MAGNSQDRKKALIVSMLLFLMTGGGIFLFFVVQGSNDLIGKGKEFSYGGAAREGVSSFFKYVGASFEDEGKLSEKDKELMVEKRVELAAVAESANPDMTDWMAPASKPSSAAPASVPKMGGGGLSGAPGGGGGGSRSSGGVSRFGEGSGLGNTRVGGPTASNTGTTEKGTLASLRNAKAALGEGLASGSAMTARSKWGSGFGDGSGKGGQLAYGSGGLVKLDTIKKGEVASLKASHMKKPEVPEAGAFERDKNAEEKDAGIQAAKQAAEKSAKEAAEAAAKKAAIQAAVSAAGNAAGSAASGTAGGTAGGGDSRATTPQGEEVPSVVQDNAKNVVFNNTAIGDKQYQDANINYVRTNDGFEVYYNGMAVDSVTGAKTPYTQIAVMSADGKIKGWK